MDKDKLIELIFAQWCASLKAKAPEERSHKYVRSNFEELFNAWKNSGAKFEDVELYLPKAIKQHQPIPAVARASFKKLKARLGPKLDKSEKEYLDEWNGNIEAAATEAFFEIFPVTSLDKDEEPKVYGNMSATEYKAQRKYADQFPTLDTRELVKRWRQQDFNLDAEDMIENVLGDEDETNS